MEDSKGSTEGKYRVDDPLNPYKFEELKVLPPDRAEHLTGWTIKESIGIAFHNQRCIPWYKKIFKLWYWKNLFFNNRFKKG